MDMLRFVAPWSFVGRAVELARLARAASDAPGRGLILGGPAGVGKSSLLRRGVADIDSAGTAVWAVTATAATARLPLGALAQLLPPDQPSYGASGLLRWAADTMERQAAGRPAVLAVDDAHLLDPLSAALIHQSAQAARITVLGTVRAGEPVPDSVRALWADDLVERVELGPLTPAEVADLLAGVLDGPLDEASIDRLRHLSQGNPLLLRELVTAAVVADEFDESYGVRRWSGRLELSPTLTELVDEWIGPLTPDVRTVLELVAFGEPIGLSLLTKAADTPSLELAEERGLIRVIRDGRRTTVHMGHPLYRELVVRRCPLTRGRRHLVDLAVLVESTGSRRRGDQQRVAAWRLDGDAAPEPDELLAAARAAFAGYDVALATRLARAAVARGGGFDAAEVLAAALLAAGEPAEAVAVLEAAAESIGSAGQRARWLAIRATAGHWGLGDPGAAEVLAAGLGTLTGPAERAWPMAVESAIRLHLGEPATAERLARAVLAAPALNRPALNRPTPDQPTPDQPTPDQPTPDEPDLGASVLARSTSAYLAAVRGAPVAAAHALAEIDLGAAGWRVETPYLRLAVEVARGTALVLAGDLTGAAKILTDQPPGPPRCGYLFTLRAQIARLRGAPADGLRAANQAAALATPGALAGLAHAERAHAAALAGAAALAAEAMAEADRTHREPDGALYPWIEQARCWVLACGGDIDAAVEAAGRLAGRLRGDGFHAYEVLALHDLVRLGRAGSRLGRAGTVARRLDSLAPKVSGPFATAVARQARASVARDPAELLAAAENFAELGMSLYAAEAAEAATALLRAARSTQAPSAGQRLAGLRAACPLARTPALSAPRPVLTPRELQIAQLAAVGVPSREIAGRLFLSSRTVDNHLTRTYAKLGIVGRSELAEALRLL